MTKNALGNAWLRDHYKIYNHRLTHVSYSGSRAWKETDDEGIVIENYPPNYAPLENPPAHIEFALKYDHLNLDFLNDVFARTSLAEITGYIQSKPKGSYQRRIGYLFEWLTGKEIPGLETLRANYIDLLDEEKYVTGKPVKNQKWLINDNLLGTSQFCPVIRKTQSLQQILQADYRKMVNELRNSFPPDVFNRAVNYLYTKETRSSYKIEREQPTQQRINQFVRLLEKAGEGSTNKLLSDDQLTRLQNEIVDSRFAATGFRDFQNYIGQTSFNYKQIIHYVCPPPEFVASLMQGLADTTVKAEYANAIVSATVTAFGFVFIHPFEDGNGRLHRFLIHDMLTRRNIVPAGMIIPVSAHMADHIKDYDAALESYSKPLLERVRYELDDSGAMQVTNAEMVEGYFRYPDLTEQCVYLGNTIGATISEDVFDEMDFLLKYDELKIAIRDVVDMPDRYTDLFIKFTHQNKGRFPARRRKDFEKLTDDEIAAMENAFREIFHLPAKDDLM